MTAEPVTSSMRVRRPQFEFDDVDPIWATNVPAVLRFNAQGIVPAYIEPFLIQVMRRAQAELDPVAHAQLIADIEVFNKQEAQHYRWHRVLNKRVRENGYDGMAAHEQRYEADYARMLANDSLRDLLAYCEGFEAMGLASATGIVDGEMERQLGDADPRPVLLWRWHLAEEYEHRSVAHDVLKALYGRNPLTFYWVRVSGLFRAARHIGRTIMGLERYMSERYRELHGVELPRSKRLDPAVRSQMGSMLRALSPTYDPAKVRAPRRNDDVLSAV